MMQFAALRRAIGLASMTSDCERVVAVGDRFYEHGNRDMVWVVERLLEPRGTTTPHAVISHARMPSEKRLIALTTLCDSARFERDQRIPGPTPAPASVRRRRHDAPVDGPHAADIGVI